MIVVGVILDVAVAHSCWRFGEKTFVLETNPFRWAWFLNLQSSRNWLPNCIRLSSYLQTDWRHPNHQDDIDKSLLRPLVLTYFYSPSPKASCLASHISSNGPFSDGSLSM